MSTDSTQPTAGDGQPLEKSWDNPFPVGTEIHDIFERRVKQEKDIIILIDDYHADRGSGKSVASLQLAAAMDQTAEGITTSKVAMNPEKLREAYSEEPIRSGLVLDEGEVGVSNRQAMTKVNQAIREILAMGRVEQKYVVVNTPAIGFLDKDIIIQANLWMTMVRRGVGRVHHLKRNPYANSLKGQTYPQKIGLIEFRDIASDSDLRDVYNYLTREKRKHIAGDEGDGYIPRSEHRDVLKKAKDEAKRQQRNDDLRAIAEHDEVQASHRMLAEAVGLSQSQVSRILSES